VGRDRRRIRLTEDSMKHFVQFVTGLAIAAWLGSTAYAQGTPASDLIWSAQADVAATFGHKSSSAAGGELGLRLEDRWDAFLEIGRMANVTTTATEDRARIIGNAIGATANPIQHAIYFDVGGRYSVMPASPWHPFVLAGLGIARVHAETTFSRSGATISDSDLANVYGVQLGTDLSGSLTKALFTLGGGVTRPFRNRYFVDGTYRYGRIFARKGAVEGDKGINTQRLQIGVGLRF
jgi:opacity protein-like surface antigen